MPCFADVEPTGVDRWLESVQSVDTHMQDLKGFEEDGQISVMNEEKIRPRGDMGPRISKAQIGSAMCQQNVYKGDRGQQY